MSESHGEAPSAVHGEDAEGEARLGSSPAFHLGLFLLTAAVIVAWWPSLREGLLYAAGVLSILLAHEFGHYFAARRYGVEVTLPYFLPGLPPLYTFGAFIKMQVRRVSPEALLVIGAAGPIAGMVVALPLFVIGMSLSEVAQVPALTHPDAFSFGTGLLGLGIEQLLFGSLGEEVAIYIHPLGYAGWVGFFVTALNLVPIGQLDGGHIAYAMFGERYRRPSRWLFWGLVLCGVLFHPVWIVLSIFLTLTGVEHPPLTTREPLPRWAQGVGWGCLAIFVLTFMPVPLVFTPPLWEMVASLFG